MLNLLFVILGAGALIAYFVFRAITTQGYFKNSVKSLLMGALCFGVYLLGYLVLAMLSAGQYGASETASVGWLFAAALAVSLVLTEVLRYFLMRSFVGRDDPFIGFQFGVGFATAEYLAMFLIPSVMSLWASKTSLLGAAIVILVHTLLQISGSATAFAWLKKERMFGFFTAHLPYYAAILLSYILQGIVAQGIAFVFLLAVAAALCWMAVDAKDFK